MCFLCPELQMCNIFFVGCMLHLLMCFLCPKFQLHNPFFHLLRVAPHPPLFFCVQSSKCVALFFYCMLHPTPSFMFLVSTTLSVQCYFVLLHLPPFAPFPLCFLCPQLQAHNTFFCCTSPLPPFLYVFRLQSSKCATCFFFFGVLHLPPFHFVFCIQTSKHTMLFIFCVVCCTCPLCSMFFCVQSFKMQHFLSFAMCYTHPTFPLCFFFSQPPSA